MKTTIELEPDLLHRAKQRALDTGCSLKAVIEAALTAHLGAKSAPSELKVITFGPNDASKLDKIPVSIYPEDQSGFWEPYKA
jgi:hypothetical protein